ncbi:hypothetical protein BRC63_00330 [Halobacteriales archaeon QH_10_70_21]|nr:MAG: hypothetical protein BRC63_00330 [Halobacteriales archaeon QH_10_70_21]
MTALVLPCTLTDAENTIDAHAVLVDPDDEAAERRAEEVYDRIVEQAIEWGGTATGEHGIGMGKRTFLELEHGAGGVETMRALKGAFDPNDILNPGKMFPETDAEGARVELPQR